jgi:hypothetical protein
MTFSTCQNCIAGDPLRDQNPPLTCTTATTRYEFDSGEGETFSRQPALAYSPRKLSKQPEPSHGAFAGLDFDAAIASVGTQEPNGSQTLRWREVDSNPRSPVRSTTLSRLTPERFIGRTRRAEGDGFEPSVPREDEPRKGAVDPLTTADSKVPHHDGPAVEEGGFELLGRRPPRASFCEA